MIHGATHVWYHPQKWNWLLLHISWIWYPSGDTVFIILCSAHWHVSPCRAKFTCQVLTFTVLGILLDSISFCLFFKPTLPHFYFNVPFPVESGLACYSFRLFSEGFDLPLHTWSVMNRFRTGQGSCRADLRKWGLAQSPSSDCGQRQTMNHIVDMCPLTKFEGGLNLLHKADDDAVMQLESTATAALAK